MDFPEIIYTVSGSGLYFYGPDTEAGDQIETVTMYDIYVKAIG